MSHAITNYVFTPLHQTAVTRSGLVFLPTNFVGKDSYREKYPTPPSTERMQLFRIGTLRMSPKERGLLEDAMFMRLNSSPYEVMKQLTSTITEAMTRRIDLANHCPHSFAYSTRKNTGTNKCYRINNSSAPLKLHRGTLVPTFYQCLGRWFADYETLIDEEQGLHPWLDPELDPERGAGDTTLRYLRIGHRRANTPKQSHEMSFLIPCMDNHWAHSQTMDPHISIGYARTTEVLALKTSLRCHINAYKGEDYFSSLSYGEIAGEVYGILLSQYALLYTFSKHTSSVTEAEGTLPPPLKEDDRTLTSEFVETYGKPEGGVTWADNVFKQRQAKPLPDANKRKRVYSRAIAQINPDLATVEVLLRDLHRWGHQNV
jgi:hypothetical protein